MWPETPFLEIGLRCSDLLPVPPQRRGPPPWIRAAALSGMGRPGPAAASVPGPRGRARVHPAGRAGPDPSQPQRLPRPRPGGPRARSLSRPRLRSPSARGGAWVRAEAPPPRPVLASPAGPPTPPAAAPRPAPLAGPALHFPLLRSSPRAALHTWRSPRPCALIGREPAAWGRARARPGRGRKVAAARRGGRGALTRMFTPGHPGKWKRRALLRGGEPQTPGPGPPPPPPPW